MPCWVSQWQNAVSVIPTINRPRSFKPSDNMGDKVDVFLQGIVENCNWVLCVFFQGSRGTVWAVERKVFAISQTLPTTLI